MPRRTTIFLLTFPLFSIVVLKVAMVQVIPLITVRIVFAVITRNEQLNAYCRSRRT